MRGESEGWSEPWQRSAGVAGAFRPDWGDPSRQRSPYAGPLPTHTRTHTHCPPLCLCGSQCPFLAKQSRWERKPKVKNKRNFVYKILFKVEEEERWVGEGEREPDFRKVQQVELKSHHHYSCHE